MAGQSVNQATPELERIAAIVSFTLGTRASPRVRFRNLCRRLRRLGPQSEGSW
jgi:hypothetical protein